jgi:cellulose synthase/poly-beta-1,6-N-acetylglucosamine synthase-like glycosyltransferase
MSAYTSLVVVFWAAIGTVVYAYAGYPVVLVILSMFRIRRPHFQPPAGLPRVSLLISAHNEATVIAQKIENSLALDYPRDLLEIIVISDASTDSTDAIVTSYRGRSVILKRYDGHIGKTACLNRVMPSLAGEIVIFSDANSQYDTGALRHLIERFSDPSIGWVTGTTRYESSAEEGPISSAGLYTRIEQATKILEGRIGSCVGADGAIFAIRKSLYRPLNESDINDFVIPAVIKEQGYNGVLAPQAFCVERSAGSVSGEFTRHIRITTRTLRAIFNHRGLLNPFRFPLFAFQLASHKLVKFIVPFALCAIFATNALIIVLKSDPLYIVFFCLQLIVYILWLADWLGFRVSFLAGPCRITQTFCAVNLAILIGWIKFFKGEKFTTWATGR